MEHRRQEPSATAATAAEEEEEFSLREWAVKARMVSRVNTGSRRFSASYATTNTSFREDTLTAARSFRSSITTTVSSTASSPGYTFRGEIDPSTYSFTTAIKALQARSSGYNWDCLSPDQGGYTLHSKWNEAEKYICNPLSGQVPLECLSAKTLLSSGRSFRHNIPGAGRVTMSAPLIYHPPPHSKISNNHVLIPPNTKPPSYKDHKTSSIQDKQPGTTAKRDVGIQSTLPELSSSTSTGASTSPATPPIKERSITKREIEEEDSPSSNNTDNTKLTDKEETRDKVEETKMEGIDDDYEYQERKANRMCMCKQGGCGLLSWKSFWMRKRHGRDKQKARTNTCLHDN